MSDGVLQLPTDGAGKKLDTEELTVGANTVHRERDQIAGAAADEITDVRKTDPTALDGGIVNRPAPPDDVQTATASSTATAAGASDDLDGAQINSGKTGKLMQVVVSASVPWKAELKIVTNAAESAALHTWFGGPGHGGNGEFVPITKEAFTVAEDVTVGLDAFRVTVTNLEISEAADLYATFIYDEV